MIFFVRFNPIIVYDISHSIEKVYNSNSYICVFSKNVCLCLFLSNRVIYIDFKTKTISEFTIRLHLVSIVFDNWLNTTDNGYV